MNTINLAYLQLTYATALDNPRIIVGTEDTETTRIYYISDLQAAGVDVATFVAQLQNYINNN
jgi:hypothetical protein